MTTTTTTRKPDQSTPAQPLPPARKVSAVVIVLWRFVRAFNSWVLGIGLTDLGAAFALLTVSELCMAAGHFWKAICCTALGITVYVRAPRPNDPDQQRAPSAEQ